MPIYTANSIRRAAKAKPCAKRRCLRRKSSGSRSAHCRRRRSGATPASPGCPPNSISYAARCPISRGGRRWPAGPAIRKAVPPNPGHVELDAIDGKCVLCVGGRTGSIDAYRQIIEQRGGRFLHHDGGLEESLHRMDGFLAAADLIICQAGCISHNAYWRVKEQCKRTGKPCIYMKGSGISALSRLIDQPQAETAS